MENTVLIISAIVANLLTTIGGVSILASKLEKSGEWRGWAETKIKSNSNRLDVHGNKIDGISERLSRHEGEGAPRG